MSPKIPLVHYKMLCDYTSTTGECFHSLFRQVLPNLHESECLIYNLVETENTLTLSRPGRGESASADFERL